MVGVEQVVTQVMEGRGVTTALVRLAMVAVGAVAVGMIQAVVA
jgi:hypothetical protein